MSHISHFILFDSNSTFTAIPKPHIFALNRGHIRFIEPQFTYGTLGGRFRRWKNPFIEEAYQRVAVDQPLQIARIEDDDLVIMSDVGEIPSGHTINLLRWCDDIPPILHLHLKNYLCSLEYVVDHKSWRALVHRYRSGKTRYVHITARLTTSCRIQAGIVASVFEELVTLYSK